MYKNIYKDNILKKIWQVEYSMEVVVYVFLTRE